MVDNTESLVRTAGTVRVLLERYITATISLQQGRGDSLTINKNVQSFLYCFLIRA